MRAHTLAIGLAVAVAATTVLPATHPTPAAFAATKQTYHAIFAGLDGSGIYRSTDGGASWQVSDAGLAGGSVYPLISGAGGTLYAAPGASGVYRSTDGGATWQDDNGVDGSGPGGAAIYGMAVNPGDGRFVYALDSSGNLFRSADSGDHWVRSDAPLTAFSHSTANALQIDPLRPSTLLITGDNGAAISTDGGYSWNGVTDIPSGSVVYSAAWSGADPSVAYAATDDGIYQTIDGGASWQPERRGIPDGTIATLVAVNPANNAQVVALDKQGDIFRSADGGSSWRQVGDTQGKQPDSLAFDPGNRGVALVGTDDGDLFRGTEGGATWEEQGDTFAGGAAIVSLSGGLRAPLPTDAVPPPLPGTPGVSYAAATHHTISGPFLAFYNRYGGLNLFGLPLTEPFYERGALVQYFERAALVQTAKGVRLRPLGSLLGHTTAPVWSAPKASSRLYFAATHHTLSGRFLTFWQTHHGSLVLGAPISEPLHEQNGDGTGRTYLVQYFQNMRLEYHPELAGSRYAVSVGLLGREALHRRGWL